MKRPPTPELLQGTLNVMILHTLERGPAHGYALARAIERASDGALTIEEGSLYPALHRLQRRGDIAGSWIVTDQNRRARIYRLTPRGRKQLAEDLSLWRRLSAAVANVLAPHSNTPRPEPVS
jgi:PadR family transcriptional regulator PadR